jgi:hypothetical protein
MDMTCVIANTQLTDVLVTCTSKQSFSYNLKVCSPAPVIESTEPGRCAEGDTFDPAGGCCLKPPAQDAGCTVFKIEMKICAQ